MADVPDSGDDHGSRLDRDSDLLLQATAGQWEGGLQRQRPRSHDDRPRHRQLPDAVHRHLGQAGGLDYLYYSIYETLDPNTYSNPSNYSQCATLLRNGRSSSCGTISWITGDKINGPMYTQDQFAICGSPTFGRSGGNDTVNSAAPPASPATYTTSGCSNGLTVNGDVIQNAPYITPPPDNSSLLTYAQQDGKVFSGSAYISISGNTATVTQTSGTTTVNLDTNPIIYVTNAAGCSNSAYTPYSVSYADSPCGNAYVVGNYSSSVTIAAQNDVIVSGNITTDLNGPAVMGLVANNFIRVMHGVTTRSGNTQGACGSATNVDSQTFPSLRIDAALLALKHSFIVDNYDCGAPISGNLTVNGAIAQIFRGTVGTTNSGKVISGYLKNYTYDDRLAAQQPPYLFDLASASWRVVRETSCVSGGVAAVAC